MNKVKNWEIGGTFHKDLNSIYTGTQEQVDAYVKEELNHLWQGSYIYYSDGCYVNGYKHVVKDGYITGIEQLTLLERYEIKKLGLTVIL